MTKILFLRKEQRKKFLLILNDLNGIKTKFKQHYKEKCSNFITALKLNNRYFHRKWHFEVVCGYIKI